VFEFDRTGARREGVQLELEGRTLNRVIARRLIPLQSSGSGPLKWTTTTRNRGAGGLRDVHSLSIEMDPTAMDTDSPPITLMEKVQTSGQETTKYYGHYLSLGFSDALRSRL
jgi:hypothetical protein